MLAFNWKFMVISLIIFSACSSKEACIEQLITDDFYSSKKEYQFVTCTDKYDQTKWYVDGSLVSIGDTLSYTFPRSGKYSVMLISEYNDELNAYRINLDVGYTKLKSVTLLKYSDNPDFEYCNATDIWMKNYSAAVRRSCDVGDFELNPFENNSFENIELPEYLNPKFRVHTYKDGAPYIIELHTDSILSIGNPSGSIEVEYSENGYEAVVQYSFESVEQIFE